MVLASAVLMGSPGPSTISLTAIGGAFGLQRTLPYLGGLVFGTGAVLAIIAAGLSSLLLAQPGLAPVLTSASAAYILYLAYRIATAPPLSRSDPNSRAPAFTGGFLLAVANPKAYMAIGAVFANSTIDLQSAALETATKTAVLAVMIVLIHAVWLLAGAALSRLLQHPMASRLVNIAFAALLVASMLPAAQSLLH
jgi:threonine/homoserine/homoserine lactone efflux protein